MYQLKYVKLEKEQFESSTSEIAIWEKMNGLNGTKAKI